jgi:hypothetical protein
MNLAALLLKNEEYPGEAAAVRGGDIWKRRRPNIFFCHTLRRPAGIVREPGPDSVLIYQQDCSGTATKYEMAMASQQPTEVPPSKENNQKEVQFSLLVSVQFFIWTLFIRFWKALLFTRRFSFRFQLLSCASTLDRDRDDFRADFRSTLSVSLGSSNAQAKPRCHGKEKFLCQ